MSATDELRRMLDDRGVEWHDTKIGKGFITVYAHAGITWIVTEHSSGRLSVKGCVKPTQGHYDGMTPEQAIAATLGRGTCHDEGGTDDNEQPVFQCSACGCILSLYDADGTNTLCTSFIFDYPRFCPACGAKVVAE